MTLRTLICFIEKLDKEDIARKFNEHVPALLPALFSAFTNEEVSAHCREKVLEVFHLVLGTVSWHAGIENDIVEKCFDETFNSWMALFL